MDRVTTLRYCGVTVAALAALIVGALMLTPRVTAASVVTLAPAKRTVLVGTNRMWMVDVGKSGSHTAELVRSACYPPTWDAALDLAPASWIWASRCGANDTASHTFTKIFRIDGEIGTADLGLLIDNYGSVTINGHTSIDLRRQNNPSLFSMPTYADVASLLQPGRNVIVIRVLNFGHHAASRRDNPAGARALLTININTPFVARTTVKTSGEARTGSRLSKPAYGAAWAPAAM